MSAKPIATLATDWSAWDPKHNNWTHVDVSMPDIDSDVIIATEDGEVGSAYDNGQDWHWMSGGTVKIAVTHWMPFPNPPLKEVK